MKRKGSEETLEAVINRLGALPQKFRRTLTLDNGTENTKHEIITEGIGIKCYFAHPYASWERGTNENANGLVRWYFPKGTDFAEITDEHCRKPIEQSTEKVSRFQNSLGSSCFVCCTSMLNVGIL
jgi:IS30 family transposase